jgi:hypothetical protein
MISRVGKLMFSVNKILHPIFSEASVVDLSFAPRNCLLVVLAAVLDVFAGDFVLFPGI